MLESLVLQKIRDACFGYIHHWVYYEHGRPVMVTARYEYKGEKTYRQFSNHGDEWKEGVATTPYPLFGLGSLIFTSSKNKIHICEGEKCAGLIHQLKWPAVSTALGAKNVRHSDFSPLRHNKQFVILRDNDLAGINYAREVALAIRKIMPDAQIQVCNLIPEMNGGDVVDWVLKYPLCGLQWDEYSQLSDLHISRVSEALLHAIQNQSIAVEECKAIAYKGDLELFDGDPQPFVNKLRNVPQFPTTLLPQSIGDYLSLIARQMSVPVDFPATAFLALIGGIIGRSVRLDMRAGQQWEEVANVWAIIVGPPSAKKSPILKRICRPLAAIEEKARQEYVEQMKAYRIRKKIAEESKQVFDEDEPTLKRYISDDCTLPKLRQLLASNPRGLTLRSDELKGQLEKFDKDGNEGDRSALMQCWAGLGLYNEDRVIRGSCLQIPLTLSWIGCIQPVCLSGYLRQAMTDGKGADGLMQRFQLVAYPDFDLPFEICQEAMPVELEKAIETLFTSIDEMARQGNRKLAFDQDAQKHFDLVQTRLEKECRSKEHPPYWESHLGKQAKLLAALCISIHVMHEVISNQREEFVSLNTLQKAEGLMEHYLEHAKRCYESIESPEMADARKIIELIRKKKLPARFKQSDIYRNNLGGMRDTSKVGDALMLLQNEKYVVKERILTATKPAEFWIVHPKLLNKEQ